MPFFKRFLAGKPDTVFALIPGFFLLFAAVGAVMAQNEIRAACRKPGFTLEAKAEFGFLAVLSHKVQFGSNGTYFDYRKEGGQDVLFAVNRFEVELALGGKHRIGFLYQPAAIRTTVSLQRDVIVDDLRFPQGTPMELFYGFPFYRLSWCRRVVGGVRSELDLGVSFQIRNATIVFQSLDGALLRTNRDVGPVPLLKLVWRCDRTSGFFWGIEADGIYAPISYLNGSDQEITGALLDASFRAGVILSEKTRAFFNLRYLGGGAVGTNENEEGPGDGYVKNWLSWATVTVGFVQSLR